MLGQENLSKKLKEFTLLSFPHTTLFLGEEGSGRKTLIKEVCASLGLTPHFVEDFTELDFIYESSSLQAYVIDVDQLTEKNQNNLLKVIEETLSNTYYMLIAESEASLLDTVLNRCFVIRMETYSREVLKSFLREDQSEDLLQYVNTPGKILKASNCKIKDLIALGDLIVTKLNKANYSNTLSIASKINYKDEYDKFDFELFLNVVTQKLYNSWITTKNTKAFKGYMYSIDEHKKLRDKRLNKQNFMFNYLTGLWEVFQ